jgi:hypothetical protein
LKRASNAEDPGIHVRTLILFSTLGSHVHAGVGINRSVSDGEPFG